MTKVKLLVHTGWGGRKLSPGDVIEVDKSLAECWETKGIAKTVKKSKPKVKATRRKASK